MALHCSFCRGMNIVEPLSVSSSFKQKSSSCVRTNGGWHETRVHQSPSTTSSLGSIWKGNESASVPAWKACVSTSENGVMLKECDATGCTDSTYIGFGRRLQDRSFRERFVIRFSEASSRGKVSLETLSSLLQEAATNHVLAMDYNFTPGKNMNGNITVTTRMHIEVDRYPEWRDLIEIDTWFQPEGKNSVRRDWIVKDVSRGESIAFATSTWVLINNETRRLSKVTEDMWQELEPHMMERPAKWALPEERRENSSRKIPKIGEETPMINKGIEAIEEDCDMNQHVNNVRYLSWMIQTVPEAIRRTHEIRQITTEYRQEACQGVIVNAAASMELTESEETVSFIHLTVKSGDGKGDKQGSNSLEASSGLNPSIDRSGFVL